MLFSLAFETASFFLFIIILRTVKSCRSSNILLFLFRFCQTGIHKQPGTFLQGTSVTAVL